MNETLKSIKADLLDRRMLPIVALVGVCLAAALAYALLGGSGSTPTTGASAAGAPAPAAGLAVSGTTPETAIAETTDGARQQQGGSARNPFSALPGTVKAGAASSVVSSGSPSSSSGGASGEPTSSGSSGESTGSGESGKSESKKTTKKKTVYRVAIEFGAVPAGTPAGTAQLTPYVNLKLQTPLPSAKQALLVFRGVTATGKSATFTLVGEAILHGVGACLPSAEQCQALDLKPGASEQLEYLQANGEALVYELRVVSIAKATAKAASAKARSASVWGESKAGRELLRVSGLTELPYLRYSSQPGVLVFAPRHASPLFGRIALRRGR
jgi:hypothetical protein